MFFSIIIPIYNAEKDINRCLESVYNQTFKDFEVIMVNDGSTDLSPQICKAFSNKDERFIYLEQNNSGVSVARNRGIEHARGTYIVFLDSDDEYLKDYLQSFYEMILSYPNQMNYWCGFDICTESKKESNCFCKNEKISSVSREIIMTLHEKWLVSMLWNKAFRADIIKRFNLRMKEELSLGEDLLFVFQYLSVCDEAIIILNDSLYCYYQMHENSLDRKYRDDLKEIYDIIDSEILRCLQEWNVSDEQIRKYYNNIFYMQEKIMKNTFRKECKMSLISKIKYNNIILKSNKFLTAINNSDCFIHPAYRIAYNHGNYVLVRLLEIINTIKKGMSIFK